MKAGAPARGQVAVKRLADEPVSEPEPSGLNGRLGDHVQRDGFVEPVQKLAAVDAGGAGKRGQPEVAPGHRGQLQHVTDARRQGRQALADRVALAFGEKRPGVRAQRRVEASLRDEQLHDLVAEERIALGELLQRRHQLV